MLKKNIHVIGVMSGTSLDGLDMVHVKFDTEDYENYKIIKGYTRTYSDEWVEKLRNGMNMSEEDLTILDYDYGILIGEIINDFIEENAIKTVDFIASHGHTIFHQPEKGITLQIGNGQEIANKTNLKVVCDFRTQDVRLGGQGAPLVPIGDKLLFSGYDACLNLGGFANVSFEHNTQRIAFDICPVNIVLNQFANALGYAYDEAGRLATAGNFDQNLFNELNAVEFYNTKPPKSLGYEWVLQVISPIIKRFDLSPNDFLRTFVEHIAFQIGKVLELRPNVLVTGGGTFNSYLIERIRAFYKGRLQIPSEEIIDYKEALVFAFLGLLKLKGEVNCLKSVTGAEKNHSAGVIFNPNNT